MGKQSLYNVSIDIAIKGYGESDSWKHHFGFRKIESHIDAATGGRYGSLLCSLIYYCGRYGGFLICSDTRLTGCSKLMENQYSLEEVTGYCQMGC